MDIGETIGEMLSRPSLGQKRIYRLNLLMKHSKSVPDLMVLPPEHKGYNDTWRRPMEAFVRYIKTLPRTGPSTLLLDEPDRSLSIPMQVSLWNNVMPKLAEKFQVIAATHCLFALAFKDALIDFKKGYTEECIAAMKKIN
jgi:hypothetical protein